VAFGMDKCDEFLTIIICFFHIAGERFDPVLSFGFTVNIVVQGFAVKKYFHLNKIEP
jgi:hypothetical protein